MCKVSIVIPTYKRRDLVLQTLDSVFAQTYKDYEVIVVNDGSPDDTREVLRPLAEAGKIRYVEQQNGGLASARNRGLKEAKGEFVSFLDDDDLLPADKLDWQVRALASDPECVLVYGDAQFFTDDDTGRSLGKRIPGEGAPSGDVWKQFVSENHIQSVGQVLMRRTAVAAIGGFDATIWGTEDYDFYISLAKQGPFRYENRVSLLYRFQGASMSRNVTRMYANVVKVRRKHLGMLPRPGTFRLWTASFRYASRVFGDDFVNATGDALRGGDKRKARSLWLRAVLLRPAFLGRRHTYYLLRNLL